MDTTQKSTQTKIVIAGLICTFMIALAIRMLPYNNIFVDGKVLFYGTDPYFYMRHAIYTATHFPDAITFDYYFNYPNGGGEARPLFPLLISVTSIIVGLGSPNIHTIEVVGATFPAILGALTIFPLYFIAKEVADWKAGLFATLILAITSSHISKSQLGFTDAHVLEVFLVAVVVMYFMLAIKRSISLDLNDPKNINRKDAKHAILYALMAGLTITAIVTAWQGAPIYIGFFGLYGIIQYTIDQYRQVSSDYLMFTGSITFASATILLSIMHIIFSPVWLPTSYILIVAGIFIEYLFLGLFARYALKNSLNRYSILLFILAVALIAYLLIPILLPKLYNTIITGLGFLSKKGVIWQTISESAKYSLPMATIDLVVLFIIGSTTFLAYLFHILLKRKMYPIGILFIVWTILDTILAFQQVRFLYLLSMNLSILIGFAFIGILNFLEINITSTLTIIVKKIKRICNKKDNKKQKNKILPINQKIDYFEILVVIVMLFIFIVPNLFVDTTYLVSRPSIVSGETTDWYDSLIWMRDSTPQTQYYNEPQQKPEYGVLSWWDYGYWITYVAHRPSFANPGGKGGLDAADYFMTQDEETANEFMENNSLKYVMIDRKMGLSLFPAISLIAGYDSSYFIDYFEIPRIGRTIQHTQRRTSYYETMLSRLYLFDGTQINLVNFYDNPLQHYRLVHESMHYINPGEENYPIIKIFEYVPGAAIIGYGPPNTEMMISTMIMTEYNRKFTYASKIQTAADGIFSITVPYATTGSPYITGPITNYHISIGDTLLTRVDVKNTEVENGNVVYIGRLDYQVTKNTKTNEKPNPIRPMTIEPLWEFDTNGNIWKQIVIGSKTQINGKDTINIYAATSDGDIFSIHPNGSKSWEISTESSILAPPSYSENMLYAATFDGSIYSIDDSGTEIWKTDISNTTTGKVNGYIYARPLIHDNQVYICSGNDLFVLDSTNGKELWSHKLNGNIVSIPVIDDNVLYVTSFSNGESILSAIDIQNKENKWTSFIGDNDVWTSPTISSNTILVGSRDNNLHAFDLKTGEQLWTYETNHFVDSTPVTSNGIVYFGSYDGNLHAVDIESGERIWVSDYVGPICASPVIVDDFIIIGSWDKNLYLIDKTNGNIVDSYPMDSYVTADVAIHDDVVYVGSMDGKVHAFSIVDQII